MLHYEIMNRLPAALNQDDIKRVSVLCSKALRVKHDEYISVTHVSDAKMKQMNKACCNKNRPTDVLSFESSIPGLQKKTEHVLGDIIVAPAFAKREAKRRSIPWKEELIRLLVHGTLHLYGFDHATEKEEQTMFSLQETLVEKALT